MGDEFRSGEFADIIVGSASLGLSLPMGQPQEPKAVYRNCFGNCRMMPVLSMSAIWRICSCTSSYVAMSEA